jgi:hypothetical protein
MVHEVPADRLGRRAKAAKPEEQPYEAVGADGRCQRDGQCSLGLERDDPLMPLPHVKPRKPRCDTGHGSFYQVATYKVASRDQGGPAREQRQYMWSGREAHRPLRWGYRTPSAALDFVHASAPGITPLVVSLPALTSTARG